MELRAKDGGTLLGVRVATRSSRVGIECVKDGSLRVRLRSAPVDGAANEELIRTIAGAFGVTRSAVRIIAGERSRTKLVIIDGLTPEAAAAVLRELDLSGQKTA
jgi:uncharacterized protein